MLNNVLKLLDPHCIKYNLLYLTLLKLKLCLRLGLVKLVKKVSYLALK